MYDWENRSLIEYLPEFLRSVAEFRAVTDAEQELIYELYRRIYSELDRKFIAASDEVGIARWEKTLGLSPKDTLSLDERKFAVMARMIEKTPYTYGTLTRMLTALCGEDGFKIRLDAEKYELSVLVELDLANAMGEVEALLRRICPANLLIYASPEYAEHRELTGFTHAELSSKTHFQIRNGGMNSESNK